MTPEERLARIQARYDDLANAESLRRARFELVAKDLPDLVAFAKAVLALTYASDDGSEFEHSEGCDGQSECGACWAADIRRVADQHLGGDR